jgi:hypothetical protein
VLTTGVEVAGDDTVVVKRVPAGAGPIESLRREGERLLAASHPGVVRVIRSAPVGEGWELVTGYGGRSLATIETPPVAEAASIVAALASTMADLHEIGIAHGRIDPSHVLVGDGGRPRLCGFGDGAASPKPEDDVAALGALLELLLGLDAEPEPIPDRRWGARRRWRGWERRALLLLADQATADDPTLRPTARRLAAGIAAAVPAAGASGAEDERDPADRHQASTEVTAGSARRLLPIVLAVSGAVLIGAAVVRLRAPEAEASAPGDGAATTAVSVAEPAPGSLVVDAGRRYRVGQDGDRVLVADWRCDGRPTPAVFRPSTQEVFVFDRWTASEPLSVRPTATVDGGVEMLGGQGTDGCPELSVRTADGALVPVSLAGLR